MTSARVFSVIKVGGSLYDLADLGPRLRRWLDRLDTPCVLVPGGGPAADIVRALDQKHGLGEEASHWLALRALTFNAHALSALVPGTVVIQHVQEWSRAAQAGLIPILDAYQFALDDEGRPGHLPHCWNVTSDSIAARVAIAVEATELILLKSVSLPQDMPWEQASRMGYVDPYFPEVVRRAPPGLVIRALNFRA